MQNYNSLANFITQHGFSFKEESSCFVIFIPWVGRNGESGFEGVKALKTVKSVKEALGY